MVPPSVLMSAAPVLAQAANAPDNESSVNKYKALAAGFQAHLSKPVEPDELVGLVARLGVSTPSLSLVPANK